MTQERFKLIAAVHVFLLQERKVLLLRRFNTGYEDGNYSVVAGHLDGDEQVVTAAIREAKEEAGIEIAPEDVQVIGVLHRKSTDERVDFFVTVRKWQGEIVNNEPDKCDDLSWYSRDALPENMVPYVRQALEKDLDHLWFDSYGWEPSEVLAGGHTFHFALPEI